MKLKAASRERQQFLKNWAAFSSCFQTKQVLWHKMIWFSKRSRWSSLSSIVNPKKSLEICSWKAVMNLKDLTETLKFSTSTRTNPWRIVWLEHKNKSQIKNVDSRDVSKNTWLEIWSLPFVFAITSPLSIQMRTTLNTKNFKHLLLMKSHWLLLPRKWACFWNTEMSSISDLKMHQASSRSTTFFRTSLSVRRPNVWASLWDTERAQSWCFTLRARMLLWFLR